MVYKHGVYTREVPTKVVPMRKVGAALPVVFGTAPVFKTENKKAINEPVLCFSVDEAVKKLGYSARDDFNKYTLSEFIYSQFELFNCAPMVLVNVFNPEVHRSIVNNREVTFINNIANMSHEGIEDLILKDDSQTYEEGKDYILDKVLGIITVLTDGKIKNTKLSASYSYADATKVTKYDIIGGYNNSLSQSEGLELVNEIFPRFREVPGVIIAPKYSAEPEVAAIMGAKAENISGHFKAIAILDLPANGNEAIIDYTHAPEYKEKNNLTRNNMVVCWGKGKLGDKEYHLSTLLAGAIAATDINNDNIPYESPSNERLPISSLVIKGEEVWLDVAKANYLNGNGIITALNFTGGWKSWGNRTGTYPGNTDPKDSFIPIRRMQNWIANTIILSMWEKVDSPMNRVLIDGVVDSLNYWLNGLTASGALLGGKIEFRSDDNNVTDLMDGIIKFRVSQASPPPARSLDFIVEYDIRYFKNLFK